MLQPYSKIYSGENAISMELVCNDGKVRMCRTEEYADGFRAFLKTDDGDITNHAPYKTSRRARNAAAKWIKAEEVIESPAKD
jgi:hypothetical protein